MKVFDILALCQLNLSIKGTRSKQGHGLKSEKNRAKTAVVAGSATAVVETEQARIGTLAARASAYEERKAQAREVRVVSVP